MKRGVLGRLGPATTKLDGLAAVVVFSSLIRAATLALVNKREADAGAPAFEYPAEM